MLRAYKTVFIKLNIKQKCNKARTNIVYKAVFIKLNTALIYAFYVIGKFEYK